MKLTVAMKLASLAGAALLGIALLAGLSQYQMNAVYNAASYSTVNTVPSLVVLDKLRDAFLRMRNRVSQHVLNTDDAKMAEIDNSLVESRKLVEEQMKKYEPLISDDKDKNLLAREREIWVKILPQIEAVLVESRANRNDAARKLLDAAKADLTSMSTALDAHFDYNVELGELGAKEAVATKEHAARFALLIAVATLIVITVIGYLINRAPATPTGR